MDNIFLSEIYIYPIKSLGGIKLSASEFGERGLKYDRRWMLVDQDNKFISQRQFPKMSLISTKITEDYLICSAPEFNDLKIPLIADGQSITVNVWRSYCQANVYEDKINNWFSDFIDSQVKLVYMPDSSRREVNPDYAVKDDIVSFADGYPFLLIGQASLDDLNSRLEEKISMDRFRPNLVISGSEAFSEHNYQSVNIGDNKFFIVKPCERCVITTIDQSKGISSGKEPLKTLATYRKINNKIIFGENIISQNKSGLLKIGDQVSFDS